MASRCFFDVLRELNFSAISASYTAVGSATSLPVRGINITNNTNGDMKFSDDGVNDRWFVAANSYKTWDLTTNKSPYDDDCKYEAQTTFYVKQVTAPSQGDVYIEVLY